MKPPFSANTQVKLNGAYPLPFDMVVSAVYQNIPGIPVTASAVYTTTDVAKSLGRPLAGSVQSVTIDVIAPSTVFEGRINQLDLRWTKKFRVGRARFEGNLDPYNVIDTNGDGVITKPWNQPVVGRVTCEEDSATGRMANFDPKLDTRVQVSPSSGTLGHGEQDH